MPSLTKSLHFSSSALITSVSVCVLGFAISTDWAKIERPCAMEGSTLFNGSAAITLGLFDGILIRLSCPSFGASAGFEVIPTLREKGTTPLVLHILVVCLLALCLLFSAGSILISLYNIFSNPYETYMGPVGVYTCSSISACASLVILIIFVVNVSVTNIADDLITVIIPDIQIELGDKSMQMGVGYYLVIPYLVLTVFAIVLVYMYQHVAYTHRREQERPTEDAPKEIMMY
ncbi:clarin-3 [Odontesthes bonariensis]|uniref:clarin-3 n=1 Tax=Odontesthes bonariensis TaxID=219752 RepID=UPI003F58A33C